MAAALGQVVGVPLHQHVSGTEGTSPPRALVVILTAVALPAADRPSTGGEARRHGRREERVEERRRSVMASTRVWLGLMPQPERAAIQRKLVLIQLMRPSRKAGTHRCCARTAASAMASLYAW